MTEKFLVIVEKFFLALSNWAIDREKRSEDKIYQPNAHSK